MLATASASVVRQGCIVEDGSPADATTNSYDELLPLPADATICFMEEEHWNCYLWNILPRESIGIVIRKHDWLDGSIVFHDFIRID